MKMHRWMALYAATLAMTIAGVSIAADDAAPSRPGTLSAQPGASAPAEPMRSQPGGDDRTLELAPQPGVSAPRETTKEIPSDKDYKPSDQTASIDRNFKPDQNGGDGRPPAKLPCVGMQVKYETKCLLHQEEHGLSIVSIDPNSPAAKAGLEAGSGRTAAAAAMGTAGALLGPLGLLVNGFAEKTGNFGTDGDFIVAVNDRRVRSELDLEDELAKLKPGDTMYLQVLRRIGAGHKSMRIAVTVGKPCGTVADNSRSYDDNGAEQNAY
jgi:hypothetical protein